jgi:hypothetical protein
LKYCIARAAQALAPRGALSFLFYRGCHKYVPNESHSSPFRSKRNVILTNAIKAGDQHFEIHVIDTRYWIFQPSSRGLLEPTRSVGGGSGFFKMFGLTHNRHPDPKGLRTLVIVQQAFRETVDVLDMKINT